MLSAVYLFFPQKKAKKVYLIAVFVLLTLVMAFRSQQVGVDAAAYCSYYMRIGISDQFMNIVNAAPLYSIYNRLLYYLFPYEQAILVFNAIIVNSCFGYFIYKRSEHPVFSSICYLLLYTYMNTFNGTRQYIACGLFLVGIIFLQEKKTVRAVLWMIAALGVHQMVFVMLPIVLFVLMQRWTKGKSLFWGAGIIFGGSLILSRFYQQILLLVARMLPAYRKYVEGLIPFFNEEAQGRNIYLTIFLSIFVILGYFKFYEDIKTGRFRDERVQSGEFYIMLMATNVSISRGLLFASNTGMARIREFYSPYFLTFLPYLLYRMVKQYKAACFAVGSVLMVVMTIQLLDNYAGVVPYVFWR